MSALARLTEREQLEYEAAGAEDREWFACRPGRRFRLRPAEPSETKALSRRQTATHILVRKVHDRCRLRLPMRCTGTPGDLPDNDAVLNRLAAGSVYRGLEGRA